MIWVCDFTYVRAANRFYYLCAVLDLFARKIVSFKLSDRINTQLAIDTVSILHIKSSRIGCAKPLRKHFFQIIRRIRLLSNMPNLQSCLLNGNFKAIVTGAVKNWIGQDLVTILVSDALHLTKTDISVYLALTVTRIFSKFCNRQLLAQWARS